MGGRIEDAACSKRYSSRTRKVAARLFTGIFNERDLDASEELLAADFLFHNAGRDVMGRAGWRAFAGEWLAGFADTQLAVHFTMAEGDRVLLHWRAEGTHTGDFRDIPATGRRVSASGLSLMRLASGTIVEMWDETEAFGVLQGFRVT